MLKNIIVILSALLFSFKESKHPLKLSATLIEYNQQKGVFSVETKFFCDDFALSIDKIRKTPIDLLKLSKEDLASISAYYNKDFELKINGKTVILEVEKTELLKDYNVIVLKFKQAKSSLKIKDNLFIKNTLMVKDFNFAQINRVTLRVPPYINQENLEFGYDIPSNSFYYNE